MQSTPAEITIFSDETATRSDDLLAVELPLEIRLTFLIGRRKTTQSIATIMRTPGHDLYLAAGFLLSEGIIESVDDIYGSKLVPAENIITITLTDEVEVDFTNLARNFYASSACGVCGKISIEDINAVKPIPFAEFKVDAKLINLLPDKLHAGQNAFKLTGGIHAAGIFDFAGRPRVIYEDIGRHNAVDKLIGHFLDDLNSFSTSVLVTSGRIGFEIVQKATVAKIPIIAAIGAPSSLAVTLAEKAGITLIGFIRDDKFNVYSHAGRIRC